MDNSKLWNIIIAPNGWIFAGRPQRDGDSITLHDAYIVRRYSKEKRDGLGGLAHRGPTDANDELERCYAPLSLHVLNQVAALVCNDEAWTEWHAKLTGEPAKKAKR